MAAVYKLITATLGVWLWLYPALLPAFEVQGLYEAEVPVQGQDAGPRLAAIRAALREVLVKVSGQRERIEPALPKEAERYVQQYRYRGPATDPSGPAADQDRLWVQFDPIGVDTLLRQAGLPVWGRQRPVTLAWLVVDQGAGQRQLVGSEGPSAIPELLLAAANRRGVPLFLPLLDIEDRNAISVGDLWGRFEDTVRAASARYGTDAVLIGRLSGGQAPSWRADWMLLDAAGATTWDGAAGGLEQVLDAGLDGVADRLAERFATPTAADAKGKVAVAVEDIGGFEDYGRVLRYFESMAAVTAVEVVRVEGSRVVFRLSLRGTQEAVVRAISLERALAPVTDAAAAQGPGLVYRWVR